MCKLAYSGSWNRGVGTDCNWLDCFEDGGGDGRGTTAGGQWVRYLHVAMSEHRCRDGEICTVSPVRHRNPALHDTIDNVHAHVPYKCKCNCLLANIGWYHIMTIAECAHL